MVDIAYPEYIQALLDPGFYPHKVDKVELVQTHISFVLLAGEFVYKFKKNVNFGFLDFSSLEKRRYCCEQELLLNRRLCHEIYLGLVTVNRDNNILVLDGGGGIVEYGIKMRRMPEEQMMSVIIGRGELDKNHIEDIVAVLVPFYEQARRSEEIDTFGTAEAVAVNVLENFDQLEDFVGTPALSRQQLVEVSTYARSVLAETELFAERVEQGKIRDCHGDLYSANICLAEQVYIYDCIEFNRRFRYCDVASDVAFLTMDLDFHGHGELAEFFIECFCEQSGDEDLKKMLNFYNCYRAVVRGKVSLLTAADPTVTGEVKEKLLADGGRYLRLACIYAGRG